MKKFKEFLEDYDVYLDKPMGWKKKPEENTHMEMSTEEQAAEEHIATDVIK
jgi:hypothetical protein